MRSAFLPARRLVPLIPVFLLPLAGPGCEKSPRIVSQADYTPPPKVMDDWQRCLWFDFGPAEQRHPGTFASLVEHRIFETAWIGMVRDGSREDSAGPYLRDFVEGEDATFLLGVDSTSYRVLLTLGDSEMDRGPVTVRINGRQAAFGVRTRRGEFADVVQEVTATEGRIRVDLLASECGSFSIVGFALYQPVENGQSEPARPPLRPLFPNLRKAKVGGRRDLRGPEAKQAATDALRRYCDFLLEWRLPETGFSPRGNWYENAYPVRTLLAGFVLFGEESYRNAALETLDRFVGERRPDGNWPRRYFGKSGCRLAEATADSVLSRNLADVGAFATCLPLAGFLVDGERRSDYLEAARTYADSVVLPNQLDDGSFPNLLWEGNLGLVPYSVATGVQTTNLTALYAASGDHRYLDAAERAAVFLARHCREDGTVTFFRHDVEEPLVVDAYDMGDLFYVIEGLLWAEHYARPEVQEEIRRGLTRYFGGTRGLAASQSGHDWWRERQGSWLSSKRVGALYLWSLYSELTTEGESFDELVSSLLSCLVEPSCAEQHGVAIHPAAPEGEFSLAATGWAGLSVAAFLDPDLVFPEPGD